MSGLAAQGNGSPRAANFGSKPGLALAHGAGSDVDSSFGPLVSMLNTRFTVVAPTLPGSGRDDGAGLPLVLDDLADGLVRVVTDAGLDRFAILGYSLGSAVAIRAAIRHPSAVSALVLTAGFVSMSPVELDRLLKWREVLDRGPEAIGRFVLETMVSSSYRQNLTPVQLDGLVELVGLRVPPGTRRQLDLLLNLDLEADLREISVPTLVIGAGVDGLLSPNATRRLAHSIRGAQYSELMCGHSVGLEMPVAWYRKTVDFFASLESSESIRLDGAD